MTDIATKNGAVIVKDGLAAEDCRCCQCQCTIKPDYILLSSPIVNDIVNPSYAGDVVEEGTIYDNIHLIAHALFAVGSQPFGSQWLTLSRDDSFAPHGGFGYSYTGNPDTITGFGVAIGYIPKQDWRCTSATAQVFFYSAGSGPSLPTDSTTAGYRPCIRIGFSYSDTHTVDQFPGVTFTRTVTCDGLSEANTFLEGGYSFSGYQRVNLPPDICLPDAFAAYVGAASDTYQDTTSGTVITGAAVGTYCHQLNFAR